MRSITPKQYAQSLFETLEGASASHVDALVTNFMRLIVANQDLRKVSEILRILSRLYADAGKSFDVILTTAKGISKSALSKFESDLQKQFPDVRLEHRLDASLQGGAVVRVNDALYDGSLRTILHHLFYQLVS